MSGGIEDTIFSNIESGSGESFAGDGTADTVDRDPGLEQDQVEKQLNQRGEEQEQTVDEQPKPDPKQKPTPKGVEKAVQPKQAPDKEHNRAQAEKRLRSSVDRLRNVNGDLTKHNQELVQQLASVQALNGLPKQFNLSNDEVIGGLEYVALLKENPANAAKKAIEVALARGANLRDIVNDDFVPNVTLGATQRLIDERLSGLRNQQQAQNVEPQEVQAARVKTQQFLADYPDAEQHSEVVAHQMRNILQGYSQRGVQLDPYVAAEMAWNAIQDYAVRNQLDVSQPLGPQVQARQSQQQVPVVRRPMPNGGNAPVQSQTKIAPAESSNRDIVRQAMREAGYQI
jgi:hypothetical protein